MMDFEFMTYKRLLHKNVRKNVFKIQWGGIMIRNMNRKKRKLVKYKTVADYKKKRVAAMVLCKLKVFRDGTRLFPIYVCPICTKMKGVENLGMNQRRRDILKHRCVHSRMCQDISEDWGNWRSHWPLNLQNINQLEAYEVNVNEDIKFETYLHENEFLACDKVQTSNSNISTHGALLCSENEKFLWGPMELTILARNWQLMKENFLILHIGSIIKIPPLPIPRLAKVIFYSF